MADVHAPRVHILVQWSIAARWWRRQGRAGGKLWLTKSLSPRAQDIADIAGPAGAQSAGERRGAVRALHRRVTSRRPIGDMPILVARRSGRIVGYLAVFVEGGASSMCRSCRRLLRRLSWRSAMPTSTARSAWPRASADRTCRPSVDPGAARTAARPRGPHLHPQATMCGRCGRMPRSACARWPSSCMPDAAIVVITFGG